MKFDLTVTNPPYDGDLHLQILNQVVQTSDKVVCIHPARWIEDILAKYKGNGATGKKYAHLKKMLNRVMMIKQKCGCQLFNISLPQDMMIGVYENGKDNGGVLPIYDNSKMFFDVLEKILNYAHNVKSLGDMDEENKIDWIRVEIKAIAPIKSNADTEWCRNLPISLVGKTYIENGYVNDKFWVFAKSNQGTFKKEEGTPIPHSIKFQTKELAQIFIDLYRTNVVKNIIHMLKYGQNFGSEMRFTPYFNPQTIHTEDDVLDALGITNSKYREWLKRYVYDYREKDFLYYDEWIDC